VADEQLLLPIAFALPVANGSSFYLIVSTPVHPSSSMFNGAAVGRWLTWLLADRQPFSCWW